MEADQTSGLSWPAIEAIDKIDTHHHMIPDFYAEAVSKAGGDPSGWPTPSWSLSASESMMERLGIAKSILSVTAPGACILQGQASFDLARRLNLTAAQYRDEKPSKFGFFASLPDLLDTKAALEEIRFSLDELHADGVTLFTRYGSGNTYLGHPDLEPIWAELDRRQATVFVHPTHPVDTNKVNEKLPQPWIDYPHETTRTAMDMILKGTRLRYPSCKVILSHAGGNLPFIIGRVATPLSRIPPELAEAKMGVTYDSIMTAFKSFHYDLALSTSAAVLPFLQTVVPHDHIVYGSDFPYAPSPAYPAFLEHLENFSKTSGLRNKIYFENAQDLVSTPSNV